MSKERLGEGETIKKGISRAVQEIYNDLERLATRLDKYLPSIKARKMNEYDKALNAIKEYKLALQNKVELLNKEAVEQGAK